MEQKITIKIADREYTLKAETPGREEAIRKAAGSINNMIAAYLEKYPDKDMAEILSFVALNLGIGNVGMQKKIESLEKESIQLNNEIEGYLENIDK
ncbi:MAG: cell division protein ZapA [Bacteroidales bacterium]|nr:cell division protein ZapA [Bacteroides sp.]MCM1198435.1 cell division protein ZapA [Clostridium sp.]MCM1502579.1 cell division protein ZapA [Bacteroidales bacterium]